MKNNNKNNVYSSHVRRAHSQLSRMNPKIRREKKLGQHGENLKFKFRAHKSVGEGFLRE
jgi:hypothetical protein